MTGLTVPAMHGLNPRHAWGALFTLGALYEAYGILADVPGDTLSETTRSVLRTDTPVGAAVFVAGWGALTAWFLPHILRR